MAQAKKSRSTKPKSKTSKTRTIKTTTKKQVTKNVAQTAVATDSRPRRRKLEQYKSFRLHRRIRPKLPKIKGAVELFLAALRIVRANWTLFLGLTLVYALLSLVLVRGFSSALNVSEAKDSLKELVTGDWAGLTIAASLFGVLLGTTGSSSTPAGSAYQALLLIVMSLATIWALRQITSGHYVRVRETFYKGLYPLAVFICVLFFIGLQLIPMAIGSWLYSALIGGGIVVTALEKSVTVLLFALLVTLSMYMISSSLFALFISTLPDMTPRRALKSARNLVLHRRWHIVARIVALVIALPVLSALVMIPFILWLPGIAEWIFFLLTTFGTLLTVTYMYLLYRELLNE